MDTSAIEQIENTVQTKVVEGIQTITLNRPEALNPMSPATARVLAEKVRLAAMNPGVKVVIVTGAGRAFSAGGDFKAFGAIDPGDPLAAQWSSDPAWNDMEARADRMRGFAETPHLLHTMGKPTIAMIRGPAVGAGVGLAAACDFRIASSTAIFTTGFARVGISQEFGTGYYVSKLVGSAKARELFFLSDKIDAQEALRIGLVNRVVEDAALESETLALAKRLASGPPLAYRFIKEGLNAAETMDARGVVDVEVRNLARAFRTEDAQEGARAMMEKRPPNFKGR